MKTFFAFVLLFVAFFAFSNAQNACNICQNLAYYAELGIKYEGWNSTQVVAEFEIICGFLGPLESECDVLVSSFGTPLANCLVNGQNTTTCCSMVGLCSSPSKTPKPQPTQIPIVSSRKSRNHPKLVKLN